MLWGSRISEIINGTVTFSHLVITQPGPTSIYVSVPHKQLFGRHKQPFQVDTSSDRRRVGTLAVLVDEDTSKPASGACLFIFTEGICLPDEAAAAAIFPSILTSVESRNFFRVMSCLTVFESWHVRYWSYISDGGLSSRAVFEYKSGIVNLCAQICSIY